MKPSKGSQCWWYVWFLMLSQHFLSSLPVDPEEQWRPDEATHGLSLSLTEPQDSSDTITFSSHHWLSSLEAAPRCKTSRCTFKVVVCHRGSRRSFCFKAIKGIVRGFKTTTPSDNEGCCCRTCVRAKHPNNICWEVCSWEVCYIPVSNSVYHSMNLKMFKI